MLARSLASGDAGVQEQIGQQIRFEPIAPSPASLDQIVVARGHEVAPLLRWGDPIFAGAPAFDPRNLTPAAQVQQFGYNCDFVGFLSLPLESRSSERGLLYVHHEYTLPRLMFPSYDERNPTNEQVDYEIASHGISVVELQRGPDRRFVVDLHSRLNRRITAATPMRLSGPAAGHEWLQTSEDPTGKAVLGTLWNCSAGKTPWGTVLSSEEGFNTFFANVGQMAADDPRRRVHERYFLPRDASDGKWERFYPRYDTTREPNEPFRFGWAVEVDPYEPDSTPVKRTALGRFRREAAATFVAPSGRIAVYSGDDDRFEYVYKFVTTRPYDPSNRQANFGLLDDGTLYVARFHDDGTGRWLPLVFGQGPLTPTNGFTSQADVLIKTRLAADSVGATKMDRPEDVDVNPLNRKVYVALTANEYRGVNNSPDPNPANPRRENRSGHVLELTEAGDDHAGTGFTWEIFLLCGDPKDPLTYFAGFPREQVSPISNPDNLMFDADGRLWIATDGQRTRLNVNDGLHVVPVAGPERGNLQQFLSGVVGSEITGPELTPDNRTLFVSVQHPGQGGSYDRPTSTWPGGVAPPRPSVIQVWASDGGRIGGIERESSPSPGGALPRDGLAAAQIALTAGTGLSLIALVTGVAIRLRRRLRRT